MNVIIFSFILNISFLVFCLYYRLELAIILAIYELIVDKICNGMIIEGIDAYEADMRVVVDVKR